MSPWWHENCRCSMSPDRWRTTKHSSVLSLNISESAAFAPRAPLIRRGIDGLEAVAGSMLPFRMVLHARFLGDSASQELATLLRESTPLDGRRVAGHLSLSYTHLFGST